MKGFLYCFKVVGIKDSNDSQLLTNIYKIETTVRKIKNVLKKSETKSSTSSEIKYELMFYVEVDEIHKLDIFENLYLYRYISKKSEKNLYKVEFSKIKNFVTKDLNNLELRKKKILHINNFLEDMLVHNSKTKELSLNKDFLNSFNSKKIIMENSNTLKLVDLYKIYLKWFKNSKYYETKDSKEIFEESLVSETQHLSCRNSKERAGICEFLELCESYTFLGKPNEYYEWDF